MNVSFFSNDVSLHVDLFPSVSMSPVYASACNETPLGMVICGINLLFFCLCMLTLLLRCDGYFIAAEFHVLRMVVYWCIEPQDFDYTR